MSDGKEMKSARTVSLIRLTARNFSFRFGSDVLNRLIMAVVGILLANYLGAADNGRYNVVYSMLFIALVFSEMGLAPIIMRELSTRRRGTDGSTPGHLLGNAILLKLVFTLIACLATCLIILAVPGLSSLKTLVLIAVISLFFNWSGLIGAVFEAELHLEYPAGIQFFSTAMTGLIFVVLIAFKFPLWGFVVARTILGIPETVLYFYLSRRYVHPRLRVSRQHSTYLLRESLPLLASFLCGALYLRVDQLFLQNMHGERAVGVYSAAVNLVEPLWLFPIALLTAFSPVLARMFRENEQAFIAGYQGCFRIVNLLAFPLACGGAVVSSALIDLLYTTDFVESFKPFSWLLWGNVFIYLGMVNNRLLIVSGKQLYDLLFTGSSLAVNIVFNFLLIPTLGISGAALASVMAYATGPIMGYFLKATHNYSRAMLVTAMKPLLASLVMAMIIFPLRTSLWLALPAGILSYTCLVVLFKGVSRDDTELIHKVFQSSGTDTSTHDKNQK